MRIVLISGPGRIHFVETAVALIRTNCKITFICGVVPTGLVRFLCGPIGLLMGRNNLYSRLRVRLGPDDVLRPVMRSNLVGEFVASVTARLAGLGVLPCRSWCLRFAWQFYGWCCRPYILGGDVLHIRSGAGQGGLITKARKIGMLIVVDQSLAHPKYIGGVLNKEYERFGLTSEWHASDPFWRLVLADCNQADVLLVNSDFVKDTFVANGYPSDRIRVNYLGVRSDFIAVKNNYNIGPVIKLLFTGTFDLRKGCHIVIKAMQALLNQRGIGVELHVAGNASQCFELLSDEIVGMPIRFHGYLAQKELMRLFVDCDLYVFPTFSEGCAKSAMEAMLAGLPVVTTDACGLPGGAGVHWYRIELGSVESLIDAILGLANDECLRSSIGRAGSKLGLGGEYSWEAYADRLERLYFKGLSH